MRRTRATSFERSNSPKFGWLATLTIAGILTATALSSIGYGEEPTSAKGDQSETPNPRMDCPPEWLESIRDDTTNYGLSHTEKLAFGYFLQRARKFSPEEMTKYSRRELTFRRLFEEGREQYRGEIVRVEGRLKRLNWIGTDKLLENADIKNLYEAWIFGKDYFSNPTCVVISELPPGLEPAEDIRNVWVTCDGYFYKRYLYESAEVNEKTKRPVKRLAPLVLGRTLTVIETPVSESERIGDLWNYFVPLLIFSAFGMVALAFLVHRWFAHGDRRAHAALQNAKATEFIAPTDESPGRQYPQEPSAN